jgi:hypothetical protein
MPWNNVGNGDRKSSEVVSASIEGAWWWPQGWFVFRFYQPGRRIPVNSVALLFFCLAACLRAAGARSLFPFLQRRNDLTAWLAPYLPDGPAGISRIETTIASVRGRAALHAGLRAYFTAKRLCVTIIQPLFDLNHAVRLNARTVLTSEKASTTGWEAPVPPDGGTPGVIHGDTREWVKPCSARLSICCRCG